MLSQETRISVSTSPAARARTIHHRIGAAHIIAMHGKRKYVPLLPAPTSPEDASSATARRKRKRIGTSSACNTCRLGKIRVKLHALRCVQAHHR